MADEHQSRWASLMDGYLPPARVEFDESIRLHTEASNLDPITYEVLRSRFWSINWDHQETIKRVSGSGVCVYADDFNTSIQTEDGEGVVFGPGILFFAGCADAVVKWTLEHRGANVGIRPGDVFIQDDPWVGTNHQMDTSVYAPVFVDGRLFCWVYNAVHQQELGGVEPGGFVQQARDTYWEATAFPPMKLVEDRVWRADVLDAWVRRSRLPQLCLLEVKSQVAGVEFARRRIEETIEQYGAAAVKGAMRAMIDNTEKAISKRLSEIPDGTWRDVRYASGALPDDRTPYRLELSVTKRGSKLTFSNRGTDPSVGSFNITSVVMRAAILHAALPLLAYDQYLCGAGVLRCLEFEPHLGTITSARHPAGVSTSLGTTCAVNQAQYLINKLLGTSPAQRGDIVGASAVHTQVYTQMFGRDHSGKPYANFPMDGVGGGTGAFSFRDGIDHGGGIISTRLRIGNVEEWERSIPFLYLYRREVGHGGGHGRYRGGAGLAAAMTGYGSKESYVSSGGMVPSVTQGIGLAGALPAAGGAFWHACDTEIRERFAAGDLPHTPEQVRALAPDGGPPPPKKFDNRLADGDIFEVMPGSGAGHGDPLLREPEKVAGDVRRGRTLPQDARRIYGVELQPDGSPDLSATEAKRAEMRDQRRAQWTAPPCLDGGWCEDGTVRGYAIETVSIVSTGADTRLCCAHCGWSLGDVAADYRDGCGRFEYPVQEIDPRIFVDPSIQAGEALLVRHYVCPGCGTYLDTDLALAGDESYRDVEIHSIEHLEIAEPYEARREPATAGRASAKEAHGDD